MTKLKGLLNTLPAAIIAHVVLWLIVFVFAACWVPACQQKEQNRSNQVSHIVVLDQQGVCPIVGRDVFDRVLGDVRALGKERGIKVTRIYKDTQRNLARRYLDMKITHTVPAIYFISSDDKVLKTLQGNVPKEKIVEAIGEFDIATPGK